MVSLLFNSIHIFFNIIPIWQENKLCKTNLHMHNKNILQSQITNLSQLPYDIFIDFYNDYQ